MGGDFTIGSNLGGSKLYVASGDCYDRAKVDIHDMLSKGQTPIVDHDTLKNIEYVAGSFSYEDRQKLGLQ